METRSKVQRSQIEDDVICLDDYSPTRTMCLDANQAQESGCPLQRGVRTSRDLTTDVHISDERSSRRRHDSVIKCIEKEGSVQINKETLLLDDMNTSNQQNQQGKRKLSPGSHCTSKHFVDSDRSKELLVFQSRIKPKKRAQELDTQDLPSTNIVIDLTQYPTDHFTSSKPSEEQELGEGSQSGVSTSEEDISEAIVNSQRSSRVNEEIFMISDLVSSRYCRKMRGEFQHSSNGGVETSDPSKENLPMKFEKTFDLWVAPSTKPFVGRSKSDKKLIAYLSRRRSKSNSVKEGEIVVDIGNQIHLRRFQLQGCLIGRHWICTNFIKAASRYIMRQELQEPPQHPRFIMDPDFAMDVLKSDDASGVVAKAATMLSDPIRVGLDIKKCYNLFVPVLHKEHLSVYCFALHDKKLWILDSLFNWPSDYHNYIHPKLMEAVEALLNLTISGMENVGQWEVQHEFVQKQENNSDCGVFALIALEYWNGRWCTSKVKEKVNIKLVREEWSLRLVKDDENKVRHEILAKANV